MLILIILSIIFLALFFHKKGVPIFLYHQVNNLSNVTPELFEKHLNILKKNKMNPITLSEYYNHNTPKNSMLITLDDGYIDNYLYVFPLLKKYNMKATIFLNTFYIKEKHSDKNIKIELSSIANNKAIKNFLTSGNAESNQYLSWEQIKEMSESGLIDFQAHSHKHMAIFKKDKLEDVFINDEKDCTDTFLYHDIKKGFPKFPKRGEYSGKGIIINPNFFNLFEEFYKKELLGKNKNKIIQLGNQFVEKNKKNYFIYETSTEAKKRIKEDFLVNKTLIEKHLNKPVLFFCWPWGHRSKESIILLKSLGIKGFISTKKGTNSYSPNWNMIRRIELRKFTPNKFKINLFINRNLFIGKLYGWLS
ncbi:polysaccharide deacetylase family protein [Fusobacterium sp. MFO224]|uniref:polysaccharide deacetylase family protein n=1 Tax=Fusobacterium sp. MFO224 TaxID=3378070 RepID=UPI0038546D9C